MRRSHDGTHEPPSNTLTDDSCRSHRISSLVYVHPIPSCRSEKRVGIVEGLPDMHIKVAIYGHAPSENERITTRIPQNNGKQEEDNKEVPIHVLRRNG